jgi:hypothetical protein
MRLLRALTTLILAVLVLTDSLQVWQTLAPILVGAAADTIEFPTRYVLLAELMVDEDLSNAIALTAGALTLGRIIGPELAGVLVGWAGEGVALLVACPPNSVCVASLLAMRLSPWTRPEETLRVGRSLLAGLRYVWFNQSRRSLLILLAGLSFLAMQYILLMPVVARDVLNGDAQGYGLLMSASVIASLAGTLLVASLRTGHREWYLIGAGIAFSAFLMLFSLSRWLPASWLILLPVGASQVIIVDLLGRSLAQEATSKEYHGRVDSCFSLVNNGLTRLGGLQAGALAHYANASSALQAVAGLCLAWMLFAAWRLPLLRRLA